MAPYGSARADWKIYPRRNAAADPLASPDAEFVERIAAIVRDRTQSYSEAMESVTRITNEWRADDTTPRELERLARLIFHATEPDESWSDASEEVLEVYR